MDNMYQRIRDLESQVKALTNALLMAQQELDKAQRVVEWCLKNDEGEGEADDE